MFLLIFFLGLLQIESETSVAGLHDKGMLHQVELGSFGHLRIFSKTNRFDLCVASGVALDHLV